MFSSYVCPGDSVMFEHGKFTFNVRLEYDDFSTPYEWECYSDSDITRWKNDDWFYGGLVVSVSYNGFHISDNIASLWGWSAILETITHFSWNMRESWWRKQGKKRKSFLKP